MRDGVFIPFLRVPSPWAGGLCVVFPCSPNKEQISLKRNVCVCISFPFCFVEVAPRGEWRVEASARRPGATDKRLPRTGLGQSGGLSLL